MLNIFESTKTIREHKGKSLIEFPHDFCIIDIETTGLDPSFDEIIEISALKIRDNIPCGTFTTLVQPCEYIDDETDSIFYVDSYITELTGITNSMLSTAPLFKDVQSTFIDFIGDDILVGHNVNFDINFLYDNLLKSNIFLKNDFIDTIRLSRRLLPELPNHKLQSLASFWNIDTTGSHRAEKDCLITYEVFKNLNSLVIEKFGTYEAFLESIKRKYTSISESELIKHLTTDKVEFDESNPCFGKEFVFTGKLERMPRKEAMQLVIDLGGKCGSSITKNTNYLVLGNNDYCGTIKNGKSRKQKKAEEYKLKGYDIEILSENVFYDFLD